MLTDSPGKKRKAGERESSGGKRHKKFSKEEAQEEEGRQPEPDHPEPSSSSSSSTRRDGRPYTVSVALPGSIIANAQSPELKAYLAGQVARALTIYNVDEVIVFSEDGRDFSKKEFINARKSDPNIFLARILQYLETPQYLRRSLFPIHPDLRYAGLLNPLDAPHHPSASTEMLYREGVVLDRPTKKNEGSYVNIGLRKECQIDKVLNPKVRVTVELLKSDRKSEVLRGLAVPPSQPREHAGLYWGFTTRLASGLQEVFTSCPFPDGYDCTIGTSERGEKSQTRKFKLPKFKHLLVVFGGLDGIEECLIGDDKIKLTEPKELFDHYINVCVNQGSGTIRTEEALLVGLSVLHPHILKNKKHFKHAL